MKNLIYILFILFTMGMATTTFAQTCELTLDDLLNIDSQESFERVLIENNFQRISSEVEFVKEETERLSKTDTLFLAYGFGRASIISEYGTKIRASGYFLKTKEINSFRDSRWAFEVLDPDDSNSFYNRIFKEVKAKCTFDEVDNDGDTSATVYKCPNAAVKGRIALAIIDGVGFINPRI